MACVRDVGSGGVHFLNFSAVWSNISVSEVTCKYNGRFGFKVICVSLAVGGCRIRVVERMEMFEARSG